MRDLRIVAALTCGAALVLTSCSDVKDAVAPKDPIALEANVAEKAADVKVDTIVSASAKDGEITVATLTTADGKAKLTGRIADGRWIATQRLEPDTAYKFTVTGTGEDGKDKTISRVFSTQKLSLAQQTYPSVAPLKGETVGVGMPVIVTFDVPVKNRELFERNMTVHTSPAVEGSWRWMNDREVHYRPEEFWPAGTKVKIVLRLNSLPAAEGVFGQQDQIVDFTVGRKAVSVVDVKTHKLTYKVDDKVVRTIPVSTGDSTHQSRRGTKVIMEKFSKVDMDAATTGVDSEDPDYYNINDVRWAMRVTNSGEFLHAAPWSVQFQGNSNVSHGCTGMSTENAAWLYKQSRRGDVVEYVNSSRALEDRNGWTDWNVDWDEWQEGSAFAAKA